MVPRPKQVLVREPYCLDVLFDNGEYRRYDMSRLLHLPFYKRLKNHAIFETVKVRDITLEWATGEDICPDELYHNSIPLQSSNNLLTEPKPPGLQ
jgi:hypothetical protein